MPFNTRESQHLSQPSMASLAFTTAPVTPNPEYLKFHAKNKAAADQSTKQYYITTRPYTLPTPLSLFLFMPFIPPRLLSVLLDSFPQLGFYNLAAEGRGRDRLASLLLPRQARYC